ncbi:sterigmatocystin biosynthesis monooxygenase stcW [Penicillium angulare]|uniref:sterigmatocystin biosynthesis monooxygenase stcW n=1 Tax=Penicillium angulare TaxID=116970 RepID=UPI0025403C65|nr:sterigmatocystin biosynthesis monooxygenase stcW [Penicillium angulare]KAJ5289210.1 sterigmatocystin biosynthesis monooxygenase stcW [Penicillium angulare]
MGNEVIKEAEDGPSPLEMLCLRAAGGEPHYFGSSSAYSFTKLFSAQLRGAQFRMPGLVMSGVTHPYVSNRPRPVPAPLPDRSATRILTNSYFENVHPPYPFLHWPTFLRYEDEVMTACENGLAPDPVQSYFVYMVAAVGALTGPFAGASLPEGLYAAGEELFEHVLQLNDLETIQALLCCAMYSLKSPIGVSIWSLSGIAVRQCIELGLHRDIPWMKMESNPLKTQLRRRVFWCAYNLDRACAVTLGRPVGIMDSDIDVDLFLDLDDENITSTGIRCQPRSSSTESPTIVSTALHTIKLRRIWARMQNQIYPQTHGSPSYGINGLTGGFKVELRRWMETAPDQLQQGRAVNNAFASTEWYNLMYHHSVLLLHRSRLVVSQRSSRPESPVNVCDDFSVLLDCASSSQSIIELYRSLYVSQRLNDTWGALHVLFLAGITYIHCLWNSSEARNAIRRDKVSSTCTSCVMVLAMMAERWAAVAPYRDIFEMLSDALQSMLVDMEKGLNGSPRGGPVLSSLQADQVSDYFMSLAEVGMCYSSEQLLMDMI